jgi:nitroreductase
MIEKNADTQLKINTLIASRWSGKAYDPQREVTDKQILTMLEAARWAPSCYGDQPWRYIVCNKHTNDEAWQKALDCLSEGNQLWAQHAPVLILVLADTVFSHNDKENRWGAYDTGAASISMCLQATELGLMTHQMGGFDKDRAEQTFATPTRFAAMSMMAVGYQFAKDQIPEDMLEREMSERKRKPLNDLFFAGCWGETIS